MPGKKLTVKELLDLKGKRKLSMCTVPDADTAKACELAGLDIIAAGGDTVEQMCAVLEQVRRAAPNVLLATNLPTHIAYISDTEAVRCALLAVKSGADLIYSSGNHISRFEAMAKLGIPCMGHVGLVPLKATWYGGTRAVGKNWEEAKWVYEKTMEFQNAGAVGVEMECVPERVAAEITRRVKILTLSMGSGHHCDGQFLFGCDILGTHDGHYPRHSKRYANFFDDSIVAFKAFKSEVDSGEFPAPGNIIKIGDDEYRRFVESLE